VQTHDGHDGGREHRLRTTPEWGRMKEGDLSRNKTGSC